MTEAEKSAIDSIIAEMKKRENRNRKNRLVTICLAILLAISIAAGTTIAIVSISSQQQLIQQMQDEVNTQ